MQYVSAVVIRLGPIAFLAYMDDTVAAHGQLGPAPRVQVLDFAEEKEDAAVSMLRSANPPAVPLQSQVASASARNEAASPSAVASTAHSIVVFESPEHSISPPQRVSSQSPQRVSADSAHQARSPVSTCLCAPSLVLLV
jgi:hypothetical protein